MIYGIISTVGFWLILPFWLILGVFKRKLLHGFVQKSGWFEFDSKNKKSIVFYGVSVGETQALEKLILNAKSEFPNYNIILVTGTKTAQTLARKKYKEICDLITYFPFDFPFPIYRFLKKTNPAAILIVETELWPNFINITAHKKIPIYIINGRISDRTYKSYKKLSFIFAPLLKKYTKILTQSVSDNEKLISIGANKDTTSVMGNLKFDLTSSKETPFLPSDGRIIIAASTHSREDEIVLNAYSNLKKEFTDIKLLIAPRHPERNNAVFELMKKTNYAIGKKSNSDNFLDKDIILLDTMGELSKLYSLCYFSIICGSFNKTGGHNPLECIIYNKPVISGSNIRNFKDIYALITSTDAGKIVTDTNELIKAMKNLLQNENFYQKACKDCEKVFNENKGATDKVINELKQIL